jgi:cholesterol oxidase
MHLSSSLSEIKAHYQIVVIGSGYGGSIAASRLARAGQQVCILERGREIRPGEYPDNEIEMAKETQINFPDKHVGSRTALNEYHINQDMTVLVGCGLGGTSLINGNVALRTDPRIFEHPAWPRPFRDDVPTLLTKGFERAENMLGTTPYPDTFPPLLKYDALQKSAAAMGADFKRAPINVTFRDGQNAAGVEQKACRLCGDCMTGCNYHAKNTTLMNYLPDAKRFGAEIFTEIEVRTIEQKKDGWQIHYDILADRGLNIFKKRKGELAADMIILAAGTLGTTRILMRSQTEGVVLSDKLGHNFSGNGDVGGLAYNIDQPVNAVGTGKKADEMTPVGPLIAGVIDTREKSANWEDGLVIQEGTFPSASRLALPKGLKAVAKVAGQDMDKGLFDRLHEKYREWVSLLRGAYHGAVYHTFIWLVMTHDNSQGRMTLRDERIRIEWPGGGDQPLVERVNAALRKGTAELGGTFITNPLWSHLPSETMITAHPLGGCGMAEDASAGVVNHKGQVFAGKSGTAVYPNLYICDGSVLPHSIGVNLLLTISAMTERAVALLADDRGWTIDYG